MMLMGNRKFLKHFNSAHRINNSHQLYAKKLRIYCLPKVIIGSFILQDKGALCAIVEKSCNWTKDKAGCLFQ